MCNKKVIHICIIAIHFPLFTYQSSVNEVRLKFSEPTARHKSSEANKLLTHRSKITSVCIHQSDKIAKRNTKIIGILKNFFSNYLKLAQNIFQHIHWKSFTHFNDVLHYEKFQIQIQKPNQPRAKLRASRRVPHRRPHGRVSLNGLESHVTSREQMGVMRMVREKIIRGEKQSWTEKGLQCECICSIVSADVKMRVVAV